MIRANAHAVALCLGILVLSSAALAAGGQQNTQSATTDETTTVAPATKHQGQVLEGQPEGAAATRPGDEAIEGTPDTVEGLPATEHQKQVLKKLDDSKQQATR